MKSRFASGTILATALCILVAQASAQAPPATNTLPARLSDADFWKLVTDLSERGQFYGSAPDNFVSNEPEAGELFTMLRSTGVTGNIYVGVGPEQNLTFIAALRPQMAFICDPRQQMVMQHFMYKAMFELAKDRAEFISIMFGKPRPGGLGAETPIHDIWAAYQAVGRDTILSGRNYARVVDRLLTVHHFSFSDTDVVNLKRVFDAFQTYGPGITTSGRGSRSDPSFIDLTGLAYDEHHDVQSFLSSEEHFRFAQSLHERNLIVPVTGAFQGPKALRAIGAYVRDHGAVVKAVYVSDMEATVFGGERGQKAFYDNVATLPVDSGSVIVRAYSMRRANYNGTVQPVCPIASFLRVVAADRVHSYADALRCESEGSR